MQLQTYTSVVFLRACGLFLLKKELRRCRYMENEEKN